MGQAQGDILDGNLGRIFEYGDRSKRRAFGLSLQPYNRLLFYSWADDILIGVPAAFNSEWFHLAVTYDGGTTIRLYINGVEKRSFALGAPLDTAQSDINIGRSALVGASFDGSLDEVTIYNRALAASEITAIYGVGALGKLATEMSLPPNAITIKPGDSTPVTLSDQLLVDTSASPVTLSGDTTISGTVGLAGGSMTFSGTVTVNSTATLEVVGGTEASLTGALISNPPGGNLVKTGSGTLVLDGSNFGGTVTVLDGTVIVNGSHPSTYFIVGKSGILAGACPHSGKPL